MLFLYQEEMAELAEDLKTFGLNPKDWNLIRENQKTYRIESDDDTDFVFRGSKSSQKNRKNRWEKIEILSL